MQSWKAGTLYFVMVFAAGFALGIVRVLLLVPRLGERTAQLLETPVMIVISYFTARWIVRRFALPSSALIRLGVGSLALALMLAFEFGLVLPLRGLTLAEYFAARDPVAGSAYYIALLLFALFPLLVSRQAY
jgi:hypothetical protein